ncbi:hypothetical protein DFH11DRAFT_1548532 [Phellopilus nigrolimitatus]|nr:hypothetical protein DFH11DRAFT_1814659 [Phellopilus nigrolimitatus]KAH8109051.1 hypothetical protein DFH11DRAFT_1548532 [Phellopilus nigrolimitatus]
MRAKLGTRSKIYAANSSLPKRTSASGDDGIGVEHKRTMRWPWLSVSTCTIQAVIQYYTSTVSSSGLTRCNCGARGKLECDLFSCDPSPDASIVAYVSKMFAVATKDLPGNKREPPTAQEMHDRGKE